MKTEFKGTYTGKIIQQSDNEGNELFCWLKRESIGQSL